MEWHTTVLADADILQKCALANNFFENNYSTINSILYEQKYSSQISVCDGWIYEKYLAGGKIYFGFPHNIEGDNSEIKNALENILEDARTSNCECVFGNITPDEKEILCKLYASPKIEAAPELGDYIYLTENLANLPGKKFSKKRNHIHQFVKKYPEYRFEILGLDNLESAMQVEEKWFIESSERVEQKDFSEDLQIERAIIKNALDNFEYFSRVCGMSGGIVFVQDFPVAFCLSSRLSPDVTDIHFEKCLSAFAKDGGYAVINNEFAKTISTKYINREEDLGVEGLRKAKLSYYPEKILDKYNVGLVTI